MYSKSLLRLILQAGCCTILSRWEVFIFRNRYFPGHCRPSCRPQRRPRGRCCPRPGPLARGTDGLAGAASSSALLWREDAEGSLCWGCGAAGLPRGWGAGHLPRGGCARGGPAFQPGASTRRAPAAGNPREGTGPQLRPPPCPASAALELRRRPGLPRLWSLAQQPRATG